MGKRTLPGWFGPSRRDLCSASSENLPLQNIICYLGKHLLWLSIKQVARAQDAENSCLLMSHLENYIA